MNAKTQRGILSESLAMSWLIDNGYEVFVGFGNTSCDLVVIKDGQVQRVEVKTASSSTLPGKWVVSGVKPNLHDMLLAVLPDGTVLSGNELDRVYLGK